MKKPILLALCAFGLAAGARAGDSYEHRVDESRNALGPNRCADSLDCDGKRSCSPWGWCQGTARPQATPLPQPQDRPREQQRGIQGLGGRWEGLLLSKGRGPKTECVLHLADEGRAFHGQAELKTLPLREGDPTVIGGGLVQGKQAGGRSVRFSLSLRGEAGERSFDGALNKAGTQLSGSWRQGRQRGSFSLRRKTTAQGKNTELSEGAKSILNGAWHGEWAYEKGLYAPTSFSLELRQKDGDFSGSGREPNTFPGGRAKELGSFIQEGKLQPDGKLSWRKQMDGTDGIKHAILYSGQMADDGESAQGSWQIPGKNKGTWKMRRGPASAPQPTAAPDDPGLPGQDLPKAPKTPEGAIAPTPVRTHAAPADAAAVLGGAWHGNAHPGPKGRLMPHGLSLVLAPKGGKLLGHGIVMVRGGKPRERNVELVDGSYKDDGSLRFSLRFSEPEEDDLNLNFRGSLHGQERLIRGDWDQSGDGLGNFELHVTEGGR